MQAVATVEAPPLAAADVVGAWQPLETPWLSASATSLKARLRAGRGLRRRSPPNTAGRGRAATAGHSWGREKSRQVAGAVAHTLTHLLPAWPPRRVGHSGRQQDRARERLQQQVPVIQVFGRDRMTDVIGVTKGKGCEGVSSRRHTKELPCRAL